MRKLILLMALVIFDNSVALAGNSEGGANKQLNSNASLNKFQSEAKQGYVSAQYNLGMMYYKGQGGVHQNYAVAANWYRLAAEQGHASAQEKLGMMYAKGQGVPKDYTEAMKWYRLSARQGDVPAQLGLGLMYAKGHGTPRDYVHAYSWLSISAVSGDEASIKLRDFIAAKMTPRQIADAKAMARDCMEKQYKGCN